MINEFSISPYTELTSFLLACMELIPGIAIKITPSLYKSCICKYIMEFLCFFSLTLSGSKAAEASKMCEGWGLSGWECYVNSIGHYVKRRRDNADFNEV